MKQELIESILFEFSNENDLKETYLRKEYVDRIIAALTAPSAGVDLIAAEKHVDKVLESETTESLNEWMKQQQPSAGVQGLVEALEKALPMLEKRRAETTGLGMPVLILKQALLDHQTLNP